MTTKPDGGASSAPRPTLADKLWPHRRKPDRQLDDDALRLIASGGTMTRHRGGLVAWLVGICEAVGARVRLWWILRR